MAEYKFRIDLPDHGLRDLVEQITGWGCVEKIDPHLGLFCSFEDDGTPRELFRNVKDYEDELRCLGHDVEIWEQIAPPGVPIPRYHKAQPGRTKEFTLVRTADLEKLESWISAQFSFDDIED